MGSGANGGDERDRPHRSSRLTPRSPKNEPRRTTRKEFLAPDRRNRRPVSSQVAFNNPTLVALAESRALRPRARLRCVVSVGVGRTPGRATPETRADAAARKVLAEAFPDCAYARLDPPLDAPVAASEAREDVLAAMERRTAAWLRAPAQRATLNCAVAALTQPPASSPWGRAKARPRRAVATT